MIVFIFFPLQFWKHSCEDLILQQFSDLSWIEAWSYMYTTTRTQSIDEILMIMSGKASKFFFVVLLKFV